MVWEGGNGQNLNKQEAEWVGLHEIGCGEGLGTLYQLCFLVQFFNLYTKQYTVQNI